MSYESVKVSYPVDALVSYHYYREARTMEPLVATGRLRLIGDSGAYSAMTTGVDIKLSDYAAWVDQWRAGLLWSASLDVIGDATATLHNWRTLRDKHQLETVPTVHAGAPVQALDVYAREGASLVGLGGMAGRADQAFRWIVAMFRYARDAWPDVRFHLWGVTNRAVLDNVPAWSADSSGTLSGVFRYASLRVFDPATGRHTNVALRGGGEVYRLSSLLRKTYGVDPAEITTSHPGNRDTLVRLCTASVQQYAMWLQRRHQVTPPALLADSALFGPRAHVVDRQAPGSSNASELVRMCVADLPGPRLHMAAGNEADDFGAVTGVRGPRVHIVGGSGSESSNANLARVVNGLAHQLETL